MFKFNIGERVKADLSHPNGNMTIRAGDQGTVREILDAGSVIGVEWDNDVHGHLAEESANMAMAGECLMMKFLWLKKMRILRLKKKSF